MNCIARTFSHVTLAVVFLLAAPHAFAAEKIHVSHNWAGYEVTDGGYSAVSGTWVVPKAVGGKDKLSSHAVWVGIGGATTDDLIQAGTQAVVVKGKVTYHAWYETLPDPERELPITISPGDKVAVSLKETLPDTWHLSFTNVTTGQAYSSDITYTSSRTSAEWIIERPKAVEGDKTRYLPLTIFDPITFTEASTTQDGVDRALKDLAPERILLLGKTSSTVSAVPAELSKGIFSIKYYTTEQGRKYLKGFRKVKAPKATPNKSVIPIKTITTAENTSIFRIAF